MKKGYKVTEVKKNTFKKRPTFKIDAEDWITLFVLGGTSIYVLARVLIG